MNSAIVWRGLSALDGVTPIVLVITGLDSDSSNEKTGAMVQTYIMVGGWHAQEAIRNGSDYAICGDCPKRGDGQGGDRTCYVNLATGLGSVSRTLMRGGYARMTIREVGERIRGRQLRIGTYGDPAAVPPTVWDMLLCYAAGWTGYTHQWRTRPDLARFLMASVDTVEEYRLAKAMGWRTFRVRTVAGGVEGQLASEVTCPASVEGGKRATCATCGLCAGNARPAKDVAIIDHSGRANAARRRLTILAGLS